WHSYPEENDYACYTLLGSHDKPRFLTLAGGDARKLVLAAAFLFSFPGAPAVYYGDEIGLKGGEDPDCRRCFPWDDTRWDKELHATFKKLISLRKAHPALRRGAPRFLDARERFLVLSRTVPDEEIVLALNAGETEERIGGSTTRFVDLVSGEAGTEFPVTAMGFRLLRRV
ncbi:MAG: alpha-glycosidase, partial [Thermoplasmata archaeon]